MCTPVSPDCHMYTGEAKERPLPRTENIHAMSGEARKEREEPLSVQKGNAISHYTLANQCPTLCSTILRDYES